MMIAHNLRIKSSITDTLVEKSILPNETVYCIKEPISRSIIVNGISTRRCGELPLTPYDSCRLLSLNLFGYVINPFSKEAKFDWDLFKSDVIIAERYMDDIIDLEEFDIVIVSDYDKGFLTNEMITSIGRNSRLSILDSKRKLTNQIIESFTFVKLNESEYNQNKGLINKDNIIVTLGSKGTQYNDVIYPSPNPQETIDVSGAGDTFTSSFILKYFETKNIYQSIEFANKMSSIVVSKRGVATP
jgi:hypothetical protein